MLNTWGRGQHFFINSIIMELLNKLYYDPETGFQSKQKLYKKAIAIDNSITLKIVDDFLKRQATHQITHQVIKEKEFNTIISPAVRNNYQMDIMYLPNPSQNQNFKYLLTCIDVYSRYVFVKPMKSKTGEEVYAKFKAMMEQYGRPVNLNLDLGKEFIYLPFKKYCEDNGIKLWYSDSEQENKNSIIERFHRTLRNMILKYEVASGKAYIKQLQKLINNYNSTEHTTIKQKPLNIWEGKQVNQQSITKLKNDYEVGDKVRHITKKKSFDKSSSTTNYTKTIYTITKISGHSIFLDDLIKPFKSFELVKAVGDDKTSSYDEKNEKNKHDETIKRRLRKEGLD